MALLGNAGLHARGPVRSFGILSPGNERSSWQQSGQMRNFQLHDSRPTGANKSGYPSGRVHPYAWSMPTKPGGIASILEAEGVATVTGAAALGVNGAGTSDGVATVTGSAQLVVSAVGEALGAATATGTALAVLLAVGSSTGAATVSGATTALGFALGSSDGVATSSVTLTATGALQGTIDVAAVQDLTASGIAEEMLDAQLVETGLTVRETLRLCVAALAGKVSGAGTPTITFRSFGDDKNRIVASVDGTGNRTSLTYDVSG